MFKTTNDLSEATRTNVVDLLNARLADAVDLQSQTKQAHWNVNALRCPASKRGPQGGFGEMCEPLVVIANHAETYYIVVIGRRTPDSQ